MQTNVNETEKPADSAGFSQAQDPKENPPEGAPNDRDGIRSGYCADCKIRPISHHRHSLLCEDCRDARIKLKIPVRMYVFLTLLLGVFVLSLSFLPGAMSDYKLYDQAMRHTAGREYMPALEKYLLVLEKYPEAITVSLDALDSAVKSENYQAGSYIIDAYLLGKNLDSNEYDRAMKNLNKVEDYFSTYMQIEQAYERYSENFGPPTPETIEEFESELQKLESDPDIDRAQLYYVLSSITPDFEKSVEYLRMAYGEGTAHYMYSIYATRLRRLGDLDKAERIYREALDFNATDADALRGLGIVKLLRGSFEPALQDIKKAYELLPGGDFMADTMAVGLYACGFTEEAHAFKAERQAEGYAFDEDLENYLAGGVTLEEYYIGM